MTSQLRCSCNFFRDLGKLLHFGGIGTKTRTSTFLASLHHESSVYAGNKTQDYLKDEVY
jgi:predicted chitinase